MLWDLIKKLLPGASAVSNVANLSIVTAILVWVGEHKADTVTFSYEQLGIFAGILYVLLEINRKTQTN